MSNSRQVVTDSDGVPTGEFSADHVWVLHPEMKPEHEDPHRRELREFFHGLGAGARRRYRKVVPAPVRSRAGLVVISALLSVGLLTYESWQQRPPTELPIELQGAWNTHARNYADRAFWIGKHEVAFQTGPTRDEINVFRVTSVAQRAKGDTTEYRLEYGTPGATSVFEFKHTSLPHPAIVFSHQANMVWTVTPDLHSPAR